MKTTIEMTPEEILAEAGRDGVVRLADDEGGCACFLVTWNNDYDGPVQDTLLAEIRGNQHLELEAEDLTGFGFNRAYVRSVGHADMAEEDLRRAVESAKRSFES